MKKSSLFRYFITVLLLTPCAYAQQLYPDVVARVGEVSIPTADYIQSLRQAVRSKFYHGKTPNGAFEALRQEVMDQMINRVLLVNEAKSLGRRPDEENINERYGRLLAQHGEVTEISDDVKQNLRSSLVETDMIEQMHQSVFESTSITGEAVQEFYDNNANLFTLPEQLRISMILLKVDPSSPQAAWDGAIGESSRLVKMLKGGESFAELARIHSADASAQRGGDMGYMHRGMLAGEIQAVLDGMALGAFSEPVVVLEGIAIFQLNDRKSKRLLPLIEVEDRARKLVHQNQVARNWQNLLDRLRLETRVEINEAVLSEIKLG